MSWMVIELNRSYRHKHEKTHHRMSNRLALFFSSKYIFIKGCVFFHMFRNEWNSLFFLMIKFFLFHICRNRNALCQLFSLSWTWFLYIYGHTLFRFLWMIFFIKILMNSVLWICASLFVHTFVFSQISKIKSCLYLMWCCPSWSWSSNHSAPISCVNVILWFFIAFSVLSVSSINSCVWLSQYLSRFFLSYESHVLFHFPRSYDHHVVVW